MGESTVAHQRTGGWAVLSASVEWPGPPALGSGWGQRTRELPVDSGGLGAGEAVGAWGLRSADTET